MSSLGEAIPKFALSFQSTPGISRAVPPDDLVYQVFPEPSGQWARAQQKAVINRSKDRVVQYFRIRLRPQLALILASLQIGDGSSPPGANPSVEELLQNARLALTFGDQPGHCLAERPLERIDQAPHSKP